MTAQNSNYNFDADVNRDGIINGADVKLAKQDLGVTTKVSPVVSVNLDPASDPAANRTTTFSTVHFAGMTTPGATVTFLDQNGRRHHDGHGRLDRGLQHHGSARERVEHVHGDDAGRIRAVDHRRDLAGGLLAADS